MEEVLSINGSGPACFDHSHCTFQYKPCQTDILHPENRYKESSAAWVLIAAIIVFFMKAGFMLLEVAFARNPKEKRYVVILKHQDAFASAFGFFLLGYDFISQYLTTFPRQVFRITDPVLWFFKFTFASNAATIVGGCLVTSKYKLRVPAAFVSAFVISGIIHPAVARIIWSDHCDSWSPYRFCYFPNNSLQINHTCSWDCDGEPVGFLDRMYILDFAGGGAVHLIGGMAGLMVCLFAKFKEWRDKRMNKGYSNFRTQGVDVPEEIMPEGFWEWMYPAHGGEETVSEAALGVIILWFCWFAFNCGSAESVETGFKTKGIFHSDQYPFYGIPAVIAINMIMACASGGTVAILIAAWAQVRHRTESMNANEIANGVLSALVSITAGCAFVDYWGAIFIGVFGVIFYHIGCFWEYKFKINDTARVVPVHGMCGLWSLLAAGLFLGGSVAECNLHAAFEGLCYCQLRLPHLNYGERLLAQLIGGLIMIGIGLAGSFVTYFILYIVPIAPFVWAFDRIFFLSPQRSDGVYKPLCYRDGWLLTNPDEDFGRVNEGGAYDTSFFNQEQSDVSIQGNHGIQHVRTQRSNLGTTQHYGSTLVTPTPSDYTNTVTGTISQRGGEGRGENRVGRPGVTFRGNTASGGGRQRRSGKLETVSSQPELEASVERQDGEDDL